jgi:glycosyltransferase involved in cell wall biosynthesis
MTRVLMVSKPVCPPWSDSSKNLARDIAVSSTHTEYWLLGRPDYQPEWPRVHWEPIYKATGGYAPGLAQNARVFLKVLTARNDVDAYHFFFAPNPLSSKIAGALVAVTGRPTLHTICSVPKSFEGIKSLMFADAVVALSDYTAGELRRGGVPQVHMIPPGIEPDRLAVPAQNQLAKRLGVDGRPVVLFAGDYESPGSHQVLLAAVPEVLKAVPEARFVLACRLKTPDAKSHELRAQALAAAGGFSDAVVFLNEVDDVASLIALCTVSVLPTSNLHRKMDIPLVLLECMAMRKPVVVTEIEPLREISGSGGGGVVSVPPEDAPGLARAIIRILSSPQLQTELGDQGRRAVLDRWNVKNVAARYEELYAGLSRKGGRS